VEKRTSYPSGYSDQISLPLEDFDLASAGMFWEVDGASGEDASDGLFVGGDGWELGQELARMDEESLKYCGTRNSWFVTAPSARFGMTVLCLTFRDLAFCVGRTVRRGIEAAVCRWISHLFFDPFNGVGLSDFEFSYGSAAQGFQVRSAAQLLTHFVGYGTHVGPRCYAGAEGRAGALDGCDDEFFDLYLHWLENYFLLFSG